MKLFRSLLKLAAIIFLPFITTLFTSCGGDEKAKTDLRNQFHNDLESYDGWVGVGGYYNLKSGEGHSGQHCLVTDQSSIYSMSFVKPLSELGDKKVKRIHVSVWLKCLAVPANGSYVVSIERGNEILKYFSFDLSEQEAVINQWVEVKGTAELPLALPKDAVVKIYFWNKSKASTILVDDFEFVTEY